MAEALQTTVLRLQRLASEAADRGDVTEWLQLLRDMGYLLVIVGRLSGASLSVGSRGFDVPVYTHNHQKIRQGERAALLDVGSPGAAGCSRCHPRSAGTGHLRWATIGRQYNVPMM